MRSQLIKRIEDPKNDAYPILKTCRAENSLIVLFTGQNKGFIVSKPKFDDRPLFSELSDWDENLFEIYDDAIAIQNY